MSRMAVTVFCTSLDLISSIKMTVRRQRSIQPTMPMTPTATSRGKGLSCTISLVQIMMWRTYHDVLRDKVSLGYELLDPFYQRRHSALDDIFELTIYWFGLCFSHCIDVTSFSTEYHRLSRSGEWKRFRGGRTLAE